MMELLRITSLAAILLAVSAAPSEKKIELHDIEEDNLKSEKENHSNNFISATKPPFTNDVNLAALEFLKGGNLRHSVPIATVPPLKPQYAVDEPSENPPFNFHIPPSATSQEAMVTYLSNKPMHIFLIPRGYGEQTQETIIAPTASAPGITQLIGNYVDVPTYLVPSGNGYMSQYTPRVTYVTYNHQAAANGEGEADPSLSFYQVQPPPIPYKMFQKDNSANQHVEPNEKEYPSENELAPQHYDEETETPYIKSFYSVTPQYNKYVTPAPPLRDNYNSGAIVELPAPHPLLFKSSPNPVPKALPNARPKHVYGTIRYSPDPEPKPKRPIEYLKQSMYRPNSLVDSYVSSKAVYDYMNKGYAKDPMAAYEALSSSKHLARYKPVAPTPRAFERGFRPNQMYQTAAGGITYGELNKAPNQNHYARN